MPWYAPVFLGDYWGQEPERRKRGIRIYRALTMRNERRKLTPWVGSSLTWSYITLLLWDMGISLLIKPSRTRIRGGQVTYPRPTRKEWRTGSNGRQEAVGERKRLKMMEDSLIWSHSLFISHQVSFPSLERHFCTGTRCKTQIPAQTQSDQQQRCGNTHSPSTSYLGK